MYFSRVRLRPEFFKTTQLDKVLSDSSYSVHRMLWDLFAEEEKKRSFLYREEIAREQFGIGAGVRGEPVYYIVSSSKPSSKNPIFQVETREYQPKLQQGDKLRFELRANPVIARKGKKHDVVMDEQRTFLKTLCEKFNLQSRLPFDLKKQELKKALLTYGGNALDDHLTILLKGDFRYAERLQQSMRLYDKLEWSIKASVDSALEKWMISQGERCGFSLSKDSNDQHKLQNSSYRWHALDKKAKKGVKAGFSSVDFVGELEVIDVEKFAKALLEGVGRSKAFGCGLMLVKRTGSPL